MLKIFQEEEKLFAEAIRAVEAEHSFVESSAAGWNECISVQYGWERLRQVATTERSTYPGNDSYVTLSGPLRLRGGEKGAIF